MEANLRDHGRWPDLDPSIVLYATSPLNDVTFRSGVGWAFGGQVRGHLDPHHHQRRRHLVAAGAHPAGGLHRRRLHRSPHGRAVTTAGWAYRTSDGGTHWTGAATPAEDDWASLNDIDMIDSTHGCTVGDFGYILTTDDAGASWDLAASGVTTSLYDADFASGVGWAVGESGTILKTIDGGLHWSPQTSGTRRPWTASPASTRRGPGSSPAAVASGRRPTAGPLGRRKPRARRSSSATWTSSTAHTAGPSAAAAPCWSTRSPKPTLSKLSPTAGPRGSKVTLTGKDFGGKRGTSYVKFGSKKVTRYVSWSTTKVVCKVPSKAPKGKLTVTLTTASGKSNGRTFRVK